MSLTSRQRPPVKGVGFSDHLTVLGPPSSTSQTYIAPRSQISPSEKPRSTSLDIPSTRRSPGKRHARFFDSPPQLIPDSFSTPPRPYSEFLETSCTDSEDDHPSISPHHPRTDPFHVKPSYDIDKSTRINTKLNSLPSGGEFSLMNSSEDVYSSSSDDEHHPSSARRLVRVQGSAKLSSASGLADDSDLEEEDEFAIEGAEEVDEEEAVNVRSFGRSFARVCLKEDADRSFPQKPTKWEKHKSQVSFDVPEAKPSQHEESRTDQASASDCASAASAPITQKKPPQQGLPACKSAPPSRKSRLRLTFARRPSTADTREPRSGMGPRAATSVNVSEDNVIRLSCFPIRRAPSRLRTKSGDIRSGLLHRTRTARDDSTRTATAANSNEPNQLLAVPEFTVDDRRSSRTRKNRKMVENVSMQRDDFIDFATNSPHRQRSQWLSRLISHDGADSEASSVRDSQALAGDASRPSKSSGWKVWRLLSRKSVQV